MTASECVIYVRISKDKAGAGVGVTGQEGDCRALAGSLGKQVREVYVDNDISASKYARRIRPAYRRMLRDLGERPADVLCWHPDRLHRQPAELEEYVSLADRCGIITHAVQAGKIDLATPSGRLVARMLGAAAAYEVEQMSDRRRAAYRRRAEAGEYTGGRRPLGYHSDGMTLLPAEAAEIAAASEAVLAGASLYGIAGDWNKRGFTTSTGRVWWPHEVRRVLMRPRNAAIMTYRGEEIGDAKWPAIVDRDTWGAVKATLSDPARTSTPGPAPRWPGSGLYRCGVCGEGLICSKVGGGERPSRYVYRCKTGKEGERGHVARDAASLDAYVTSAVMAFMTSPRAAPLLQPRPRDTAQLHLEATALRGELDELATLKGERAISARQMAIASAPLQARVDLIETRIAAITRASALNRFTAADPVKVWETLDLGTRREVIRLLMTVTVMPAPKGRPAGWRPGKPYFDKGSVHIKWKTKDAGER